MRLLLRETVDQLGTIGDIVDVAPGYGRNYLLPKGIALAVTPENIRRLDARKSELMANEAKKRAEMQAVAEKVKATVVTIKVRAAGDEGRLYGSVDSHQIATAFQAQGCPISTRMILLDHAIKALGEFELRIRIYAGIEVTAKLVVADENAGVNELNKKDEEAAAPSSSKREKPPRREKGEKSDKPEKGAKEEKSEKHEEAPAGKK